MAQEPSWPYDVPFSQRRHVLVRKVVTSSPKVVCFSGYAWLKQTRFGRLRAKQLIMRRTSLRTSHSDGMLRGTQGSRGSLSFGNPFLLLPSALAACKCCMTNSYVIMVTVAAGTARIMLTPIPA